MGPGGRAVLRFGAIADIQYADVEDRRGRHYRAALDVTGRAAEFFRAQPGLSFVLHAGDLVDFYNTEGEFAADGGRATAAAAGAVMAQLSEAGAPLVCLVGNHELYNWSREELLRGVAWEGPPGEGGGHGREEPPGARGTLRFCPEGSPELWHDFVPCPGWRCLVLDPYDVSVYRCGRGRRPPPHNYELDAEALKRLCEMNPNIAAFVKKHPGENILCDYFTGLPPTSWVPFNGGLGAQQLAWLQERLEAAAACGERVAVLCHVLIHPKSSDERTLLWNWQEVLAVLQSEAGRAVQLVVSGHQHHGGFFTDQLGIHYLVLESPLLTSPGMPGCFLVIEAGDAHLELEGFGNAGSPIFPGAVEGSPARRRLPLRGGWAGLLSAAARLAPGAAHLSNSSP